MKLRKKRNLHVVRDEEEMLINKLLSELKDEDGDTEDDDEIIKGKTYSKRKVRLIIIGAVVLVAVLFVVMYFQTYTSANTIKAYQSGESTNNNYCQFSDGVLKYSRDGIAFLNRDNEEIWNQPYQIKNPFVETYKDSGVVADKGGNDIVIFDDKEVKGEIQTNLPIEKMAVSEQGIVSVILKNEDNPKIVCYDTAGNLLVEVKTSFLGTGYPMDISISEDGTVLLVPYMCVENGAVTTKVVFYNFDSEKKAGDDYEAASYVYEGMMAPSAFFLNESVSVVVGDDRLLYYKGSKEPELSRTIELDKEIKSVFHSERYLGLVLKNEGKAGYELCLYNTAGKKVLSEDFTGDYTNVKIDGTQVLMYDGNECSVFTRTGIHRFEGELNSNVLEIFSTTGINKYIVMSENGMEIVRFVR